MATHCNASYEESVAAVVVEGITTSRVAIILALPYGAATTQLNLLGVSQKNRNILFFNAGRMAGTWSHRAVTVSSQ